MSIQINELRYGNWIKYNNDGTFFKVRSIVVNNEDEANAELNQFTGIPLTPELLQALGKKCEQNNWEYQINVGALKWFFRWNVEWYSELGGIYIDSKIQYLHQLQNLYFALTGQELTLPESLHP